MILTMIVVLIVASLVGYKVISGVPPLLHTPLMSGMNALSGITVLGAIMVYAVAPAGIKVWAAIALILAMINVTGGFWVTERMLLMFKGKEEKSN
ncbi:MAG: NAD(P) transhydrogenase subunit alpha [Dethiobacteria bacterium]